MSFTAEQLREIALVLENESKFYREYGTKRPPGRNDTYGRRRAIIGDWLITTRTIWAIFSKPGQGETPNGSNLTATENLLVAGQTNSVIRGWGFATA